MKRNPSSKSLPTVQQANYGLGLQAAYGLNARVEDLERTSKRRKAARS